MQTKSLKGAAIAAAIASMLSTGMVATAYAADASKTVKCAGINACKGQGSCKSAENACKGMNGCKGQGWVEVKDEAQCKARGGHVIH